MALPFYIGSIIPRNNVSDLISCYRNCIELVSAFVFESSFHTTVWSQRIGPKSIRAVVDHEKFMSSVFSKVTVEIDLSWDEAIIREKIFVGLHRPGSTI